MVVLFHLKLGGVFFQNGINGFQINNSQILYPREPYFYVVIQYSTRLVTTYCYEITKRPISNFSPWAC